MQYPCPICQSLTTYHVRYPLALCIHCAWSKSMCDEKGNPVSFENSDALDGSGFISYHQEGNTRVAKEEHVCFLRGIKCYAEEAHLGGIVIQKTL